jgi:hypothetical protein
MTFPRAALSMIISLVVSLNIVCLTSTAPSDAADCDGGTPSTGTATGAFTAHADAACHATGGDASGDTATAAHDGVWRKASVPCGKSPILQCRDGLRLCPNGQFMTIVWFETADTHQIMWTRNTCEDEPASSRGPTAGDILNALKRVPLPASVLVIQPPGGATLVNFDTNFFTTAKPFERTVTLLGHQVHFKIRPRSFTWHYGDGEDETTTKPGAAYPALDVTHRYLKKDTVTPSVDTIWEADYQLDGGAWAPVNGTVTKTGAAQQLTIKSATPILVG